MKHCLSIAGSDCSGGAGIQADLKAFSAMGVYGMSVITSVVAENPSSVIAVQDVSEELVAKQMDAVFEDIRVDGVKIGMLSCAGIMKTVAEKLKEYRPPFVVVDPVMVATSGGALIAFDALETLIAEMIPLCFLLTPNIPEAQKLTGMQIGSMADMKQAAKHIYDMGAQNVLIKGGHLSGDASDLLFDGKTFTEFTVSRIPSANTHGTGCTLSSAIAARLACGDDVAKAVSAAKQYVTEAIAASFSVSKNGGPVNHFYEYYRMKGIR